MKYKRTKYNLNKFQIDKIRTNRIQMKQNTRIPNYTLDEIQSNKIRMKQNTKNDKKPKTKKWNFDIENLNSSFPIEN